MEVVSVPAPKNSRTLITSCSSVETYYRYETPKTFTYKKKTFYVEKECILVGFFKLNNLNIFYSAYGFKFLFSKGYSFHCLHVFPFNFKIVAIIISFNHPLIKYGKHLINSYYCIPLIAIKIFNHLYDINPLKFCFMVLPFSL